ncbi:MAG TPA: hypothetical protein VIV15_10730 [Anaerolineales bacterium]
MNADPSGAARMLKAEDLLAGSKAVYDVSIPAAVLAPAARTGTAEEGAEQCVRLRPINIATLTLISRAARDDPSLVPLLMIKEALVEPAMTLEQIRQLHLGLVQYLVAQVNLISGLNAEGEAVSQALASPLGRTHLLLARHFGWSPEQVSQLTPGQVAVYLAGIEKFLQMENPGL